MNIPNMMCVCRTLRLVCSAFIALVLSFGCTKVHEPPQTQVKDVPPLLQRYAQRPVPGEVLSFPIAPISEVATNPDLTNLLKNGGFEFGKANWTITSSGDFKSRSDSILMAEGGQSLEVVPAGATSLEIGTDAWGSTHSLYRFAVSIFAPGSGVFTLGAGKPKQPLILSDVSRSGSMTDWSRMGLLILTDSETKQFTVGIQCNDLKPNEPVLIDDAVLYQLPIENVFPEGTMESPAKQDEMPHWYANGRGISPESPGYKSDHCIGLVVPRGCVASLVGLIPLPRTLQGKKVWIGATIKSTVAGNTDAPPVTMAFRPKGVSGNLKEVANTFSSTGEWMECGLLVTLPEEFVDDPDDPRSFQRLVFERPATEEGELLVDDVEVLQLPESALSESTEILPL